MATSSSVVPLPARADLHPLMADPVLHLLVGPNGAGKSTLFDRVVKPSTHLEFVNADVIAAERWPEAGPERSYEAARLAAERRAILLEQRGSFVAETVFSHASKLDFVRDAVEAGYLITLHVVLVPEALALARVPNRVAQGGHPVPAEKISERYHRVWPLVAEAVQLVEHAILYDNSRAATPYRVIATFERDNLIGAPDWPSWTPSVLQRDRVE